MNLLYCNFSSLQLDDTSAQLSFSQDITKERFQFVPIQDFTETWTDEKLYAKYNLTSEEIAFIDSMIRPMELDKLENIED